MKLQLYFPVFPWIVSQYFGENKINFYKKLGMLGHNGIDIMSNDKIIRASHDGIVTFMGEDGSGGLGVVIRTTQSFGYKNSDCHYKTIYWHLKANSFFVKPNDVVLTGDKLALSDNTGMSTGAHLHFGLKPVQKGEADWQWSNIEQNNGYFGAINPLPYFNGKSAEDLLSPFQKDLKYGDTNLEVNKLQRILTSLGLFQGNTTNYYGEKTRTAVFAFQIIYNVPLSWWEKNVLQGKMVGSKTRVMINSLI